MASPESALDRLLRGHEWQVLRGRPSDPILREFMLVAESEAMVLFAATVDERNLVGEAARLAGVVSAATQARGGPKVWEAYLVLFTRGTAEPDEIVRVERDLTYCRKVALNSASLEASPDPVAYLERTLAFLFPLSLVPAVDEIGPLAILQAELTEAGHDSDLVRVLIKNYDRPDYDVPHAVATSIDVSEP